MKATGRTTRLLEEAVALAKQGKAVYVVAADTHHIVNMEAMLCMMVGGDPTPLGIKFETPHSLGNFDWMSMKLQYSHPNCRVLVDHFTIEATFAAMFRELHKYDLKEGESFVPWPTYRHTHKASPQSTPAEEAT